MLTCTEPPFPRGPKGRENVVTGPGGSDPQRTPPTPRRQSLLRRAAGHIERTLGAGILVVLPIGVTALVLKFFFDLLDPILQETALRRLPGPEIPGLGVLALLVLVYLAGLITTHVVGRALVEIGHKILESVPVINSIYSTTRTAIAALSSAGERPYSSVVLVEFPHQGMQSIGLVTSRIDNENGEKMLTVYIPTTPIPSSGFLVIVPEKDAVATDMGVDDAMKVIVSGGLLSGRGFQNLPVPNSDKSSSNQ